MYITNTHERHLQVSAEKAGALIDSLGSQKDKLWPHGCWPKMHFAGPLHIGTRGGHGPIGYKIEIYKKSRLIRFRFLSPKGFNGFHEFRVISQDETGTILRHTLEMKTTGFSTLSWLFVISPLHNSLLEDGLAKAEHSLGLKPHIVGWSLWVKLLRQMMTKGKARPQTIP